MTEQVPAHSKPIVNLASMRQGALSTWLPCAEHHGIWSKSPRLTVLDWAQ